jgi:DNA-binding SARP family transcriptional activator
MPDPRLDLSAKFIPPEPVGLFRGRLLDVVGHRVGVVLAPAGHGKTTLLGQVASRFEGPVAWYRMDAGDRNASELPTRIGRILLKLWSGEVDLREFDSFDQVAAALDALPGCGELLLVLDDFHAIAGSESERGLARLITMLPPALRVLLGARRVTGLDVAALRVYGAVQVLDTDDLRFRSWEVERLFREVYRQPLLPEDAATLTRRTEGWAAGLAMFHLITAGRPPAERRRALGDLSRGSRLVRSYLVREVLGELAPELRDFLRRTSALGVLTGELCDALLDTAGSQAVLEELEQRRLFTTASADGRQFSYHQVLLDHLELELTEQLGPLASKQWYARAADLLLAAGEVPAAFRAYVRAENWSTVAQLLHVRGAEVVAAPLGSVEELLPADLHTQDPWLLLARARRLAARGALTEAVTTFKLARSVAEDAQLADRCIEEARAAALWLPGADPVARGWTGAIRAATQRNPRQVLPVALELPGAEGRLAAGVVSLLCGDVEPAAVLLAQATEHPEAGFEVVALASCAAALLERLTGRAAWRTGIGGDLESLMLDAELAGWHWLARAGRALLDPGPIVDDEAQVDRDPWGRALVSFIDGVIRHAVPSLREAASRFGELDAPVPAQLADCLAAAAAAASSVDATARGVPARPWPVWSGQAGQRARSLGLRQVLPLIEAWAAGEPSQATAVDLDPQTATARTAVPTPAPSSVCPLELRLFGGLEMVIGGVKVDLAGVRPRARSTLRLLALKAGDVVHRDELAATLWPDADQEAALRSLQVAVSSLRSLLETPGSGSAGDPAGRSARGRSSLLFRMGESYGLTIPPGGHSDVSEFESRLAAARSARLDGDQAGERAQLSAALRLYRGDLLPEEGAAEWVLAARERLRLAAAGAAETLARCLGEDGELAEAIDVVRTCLRLDPYRDNAWRLLAELHGRDGNLAAATAARREHGQMLADLGLPADA